MKNYRKLGMGAAIGALLLAAPAAMADDENIVVGFATAQSGFMQAYDKPAEDAARIRIDEINKAGGLLGKQIEMVAADTKTDRAEGAKADCHSDLAEAETARTIQLVQLGTSTP